MGLSNGFAYRHVLGNLRRSSVLVVELLTLLVGDLINQGGNVGVIWVGGNVGGNAGVNVGLIRAY